MRVRSQRQIHHNWRGGEELLDFAQLFVAGIFPGDDHFGEAQNIFDVAEIGGLGERALEHGIVDAEELLQHAALLRLQSRKRFVGFRMHANVALQIGSADGARVEDAVRAKQGNLDIFGAILAEAIDGEQQHVSIKLFGATPDESEAAHGLVARERVAGGGFHVFHVAAENRGEKAGQELRHRADQILLVADHVRRNLRGCRLEESRGERLARARARGKMSGRLSHLIRQGVEIQHLRIGINRRDAVLIRFRLHVGKNVVALLNLHERIADARAVLPIAGQRVQHAPVVVHRFAARLAINVARKSHVTAVGEHREQLAADGFVFDRVERPRAQPGAVKGNQVHQRIAGMDRWQALLDAQPRDTRVDIFGALRRRGFDFVGDVRIRGFQFCAMHFRLPLQIRILVHFVGPHGRVQLEAASDGDDFLAVRQAARADDARNGDALGAAQVRVGQFRAAMGTSKIPCRGGACPAR